MADPGDNPRWQMYKPPYWITQLSQASMRGEENSGTNGKKTIINYNTTCHIGPLPAAAAAAIFYPSATGKQIYSWNKQTQ